MSGIQIKSGRSNASTKREAHRQPPTPGDWSAARVVYELKLRGLSFRKLAERHGYAASTLADVTRRERSYTRIEKIVARALGMKPEQIWPSRWVSERRTRPRRRRA